MSVCTLDTLSRSTQDLLTLGLSRLEKTPGALASAWAAYSPPVVWQALTSELNRGGTDYQLVEDLTGANQLRVKFMQHLSDGYVPEGETNCEMNGPTGLCDSADPGGLGYAPVDICRPVKRKVSYAYGQIDKYLSRNGFTNDTLAMFLAEVVQNRLLPALMSQVEKTLIEILLANYVGPFADGSMVKAITPMRVSGDIGGKVVSPADIIAIKTEFMDLYFPPSNPIHLFGGDDMRAAYYATAIGTGNFGGQNVAGAFGAAGLLYHDTNTIGTISGDPKSYLAIQNGAVIPMFYNFGKVGSVYRKDVRNDGVVFYEQVFNTPFGPLAVDFLHKDDTCNSIHTFGLRTQLGLFGALANTCIQNPNNPYPDKTGVLEFVNS